MNRRTVILYAIVVMFGLVVSKTALSMDAEVKMDDRSQASYDTVTAFKWHNEGDSAMPWIGPWKGKEVIFGFLKIFSENVQTTLWENEDIFASGDTVAVFGRMKLLTTDSGAETPEFTFALRAKVRDGKVVLWNWFEDSFSVSKAFHGQ